VNCLPILWLHFFGLENSPPPRRELFKKARGESYLNPTLGGKDGCQPSPPPPYESEYGGYISDSEKNHVKNMRRETQKEFAQNEFILKKILLLRPFSD